MNTAVVQETLRRLYDAIWRLQMSRGAILPAADMVAIAILEDAAKRVLKGDA